MNKWKCAALAATVVLPGFVVLATGTSQPTQMITSPSSVYWTTLVTDVPRMTCAWPTTATQATLTVSGKNMNITKTYSRGETAGQADEVLTISDVVFAAPAKTADEHLYTLTLTFDSGESRTCKLANTRGGRSSVTRVRVTDDMASRTWTKASRNTLIPIVDRGVETVSLNDNAVSAELNGACGWYEWLGMPLGLNTFTAGDRVATFNCLADDFYITIR